jgi:streptomycin 6-kinase
MSSTGPSGEPLQTFSAATRARLGDDARPWLDGLQDLIADLRDRWGLELGDASATEDAYLVAVVKDGEPLQLELSVPDGWWAETTLALDAWRGDGTPRVFEHDRHGARLVERTSPLPDEEDLDRLRGVADVARRLWISPPDGVTTVAVEVRAWASDLQERHVKAGRPFERDVVRGAVELLSTLGPTQGERVLLHGDLHLTSLALADDRRVLTGPRPLVGEREFDVASLLRDTPKDLIADVNEGRRRVQERFQTLITELGCNATRLKNWAFATAVDQAVWYAENGDQADGAALVETARLIRGLEV